MTPPGHRESSTDDDEEEIVLPPFSEQIAEQLGGVRGLIESSIPVAVFVVANILWALRPALFLWVTVGVGIAFSGRAGGEPIRHALNGLFGIAIGALIAGW